MSGISGSSMDGDQHINDINLSSGDEGATRVPLPTVETQKKKRKRGTNVRQGVKVYNSRRNPAKTYHLKAECWNHFQATSDSEDGCLKGRCIYCNTEYRADPNNNGTSTLNRHMNKCTKNPNNQKKQSNIVFKKGSDGEGGSGVVKKWVYNEERIWRAVLNLFVSAELPFRLIRHPAMIELMEAATPHYKMPSRWTASRGVAKWFVEEKEKLFKILSKSTQGVHLTTDTWTSSNQRKNYMVLTAHYIDDDWVLQKKIINFKCIHSHRGDDIGREILECITDWKIQNVLTMTVDNATSNDRAIKYLIDRLPNLYDNGEHFHVRCTAHILNLIVKDGLSEYNEAIEGIRAAVRHIKSSTQRIDKFEECVVEAKCESKRFLCSDCPTRWNSTLDMLRTAWELRGAFVKYELKHSSYVKDLEYVPHRDDWEKIDKVVSFLGPFKEKTELVSGTSYPVVHRFFLEVLDVDAHLRKWEDDAKFCVMVFKMREKFFKYWGDYMALNKYTYFALILDPRMKMDGIAFGIGILLGYDRGVTVSDEEFGDMVKENAKVVNDDFEKLFKVYKARFEGLSEDSSLQPRTSTSKVASTQGANSLVNAFFSNKGGASTKLQTELDKYLNEPRQDDEPEFDILLWWKLNAPRFPILAMMAKDILSLQVSTVASESAFSTGGRILDPYRTSLSTSLVEALICTQNWVRKGNNRVDDEYVDLQKDEDVVREMEEEIRNMSIKGKGIQID